VSREVARSLDMLGVRQHNGADVIELDILSGTLSKNTLIDLDVKIHDYRSVTDNANFQHALSQIKDELSEAENKQSARYNLGSDTALGVSLSASAGVLAWAFRGGAFYASMMAATPLWSSIDPLKVGAKSRNNDDREDASDSVERVFE